MKLERVLPYCKKLLQLSLSEGDVAIDATVGNGNDTHFLSQLVGKTGHVYGFDIQKEAIHIAQNLLKEKMSDENVTLIQDSHSNALNYVTKHHIGNIKGAVFNLGYLPGGDKSIVTVAESTVSAIEQLLNAMASGGIIVIVVYHGHPEGKLEKDHLLHYVSSLDQKQASVLQYRFLNQVNDPPFVIAIEKK
ncbi:MULTISPECIES: tRNA (mnm(5)s(2)U34)-methyltransferase [Bacillus]|uniref:tRNA (mnm(5)s(2)U34)-methyltransferase n=1 Tax=Bacillus TaxID=1386 RepID=UPI000BB7F687|nr:MULTISPECIES: class I SAM-dependent methyltransferase [Bacillus]